MNPHQKFYLIASNTITIILMLYCLAWAEVDTTKAVIHHTASPCWTTVADIDRWHKERGWDEIGYHYVIGCDGKVSKGRSINKQGAHAKGRNNRIGVVLVGYDEFTSVQKLAYKKLIKTLGIVDVERHHEKCPGDGIEI